jgi:hypothetical protein
MNKETMKKTLLIFMFSLMFTAFSWVNTNSAQADISLAQNGKTAYVIALASDAIPAEKTAAEQLQKYFQQITGAPISIESENAVPTSAPQIYVGPGDHVKVLLPHQDWKSLGADGIVIKTVGKDLILAGGQPRGTLYAVFQFLEDADCRWWTPTENTIPHQSTFDVPEQNVVYIPPFNYREHYTTEVKDPIFATIMRENGNAQNQSAEWGGHYTILGFVHTFSKLLPPEKYFQEHPEWYSDPANGDKPCTASSKMPEAQSTQLNLSDPQVLDELTKQALVWIAKNPEAGYISISQNDNRNYCQDAASMKLAEEEGSQSAPVLNFVNKVAERIHQQYPDFKVETLAYVYTEKPPKTIRPAKNVIIRLAPISSDFGHPLDSDWNAETRDNLKGWAKIAPDLFVWNYVTNFYGNVFPHPDWAGLGPDLRFFAANNVKGVFEQGDNYTNGVGDFVQLRAWLIAHLMWNPNLDQEKLTAEFLQGYYGAAAPYLRQYIDLIQKAYLSQQRKLSTFNTDFSFLTLDITNQAIQLFQQAADAVKGDKVLSDRVHRESLSLEIAMLSRYTLLKQTATREGKEFLGPKDPNAAMTQFIADAKLFGMRNWTEGGSFAQKIPSLEDMFAPPVPLPDFAQGHPDGDVIDIQEGNIYLYRQGTLTDIAKDAAASNGKAASITGDTNEWAIQAKLGKFLDASPDKWHIYAMARVDANAAVAQTGAGFQSGVYDTDNRKAINQITIPLKDVAGSNYQKIDLGAFPLSGSMYIWVAPTQNPAVTKVYLDRLILIREK